MTDIAELGIKIEAKDIRSAVKELDRLDRKAGKAERSTNKLSQATAGLRSKMSGLITVAAAIGYVRMTKQSIEYADAIAKTADKLGVTTDALQEYRFAAERSGVAQTALDMGLQRFSRRLAEADKGAGELKGTLDDLGISTRNNDGTIKTSEAVLKEYANAIQGAEGDQEKLRLAFKAFDSEGAAMVNMLRDGADGLQELRDQARQTGVVMDEDLIRRAEIVNDKWDTLTQTIGVKFKTALIDIASTIFNVTTTQSKLNSKMEEMARLDDMMKKSGGGAHFINLMKQRVALANEIIALEQKLNKEKEAVDGKEGDDTHIKKLSERLQAESQFEIENKQRLKEALITLEAGTEEEKANLRRFAHARMLQDEQNAEKTAADNAKRAILERVGYVQQTMGALSSLMSSKNEKLWKLGKAAAISSAIINTSLAMTKTMSTVPYPWNIPLVSAQGLAGMVQVQNIRAQQFSGQAHSGLDNVPAEGTYLLQKGEMVLDPGTSEQVRNGVTGGNVNINITAMDGADVERVLSNNRSLLYNLNRQEMFENGESFA